MTAPAVAIEPNGGPEWLKQAVLKGGARLTDVVGAAGLVWYGDDPKALGRLLKRAAGVRWIQLPSAGIENYRELMGDGRLWTCAKAIYGEAVAEHALALILASFKEIPQLARHRKWGPTVGRRLYDRRLTIVGGGGISGALIPLLQPFRVSITVVRRRPLPMAGVETVLTAEGLIDALPDADVVVLACALTDETRGLIGARELRAMSANALLVNVARGQLVKTDELEAALRSGLIGGAALDVTDPEPLPRSHPLWRLDNVLITPHSANPDDHGREPLARLVADNVRRFVAGRPLLARVDLQLGY